MIYKIGVDGGGTKTECILVDDAGAIVARHVAPGCNPSVVGPDEARRIVTEALRALRDQSAAHDPQTAINRVHIYAAGSRAFWRETAAALAEFGNVVTADDSLPVLELATHGGPGLVLHGGTGSFVAARGPDGSIHYAGGVGWRFGDGGSGYDLGRRAIARGLLELQGWAPASPLPAMLREHTSLGRAADAAAMTRYFYTHADANRQIAALAPAILHLASEGDPTAREIVAGSGGELLEIATRVATKIFPPAVPGTLKAGLSGPVLTHPAVIAALSPRSPFVLVPVEGTPIEGVRRLLMRA
jgi:N-acetylglucosamine kinase-like BadF-type ATPase